MTDRNTPAQAAEQPLPSYGKLPFDQLGRDVTEATMGVRQPFDFGPNYPGHAMCLINFNNLARIVDKYRVPVASAPIAEKAVATIRGAAGESWKGDAIIDLRPGLALSAGTELFLAPAAPQASTAVRIIGVDLGQNGIAMARNAALDEAATLLENHIPVSHFVTFDSPEGITNRIANRSGPEVISEAVAAIRALKTKADKDGAVCACPNGDGSLRWPCAVNRNAEDHR